MRQNSPGRSRASGAFMGLLIIVVGVALLLDNMGVYAVRDLWEFAPLILVGLGIFRMVESGGRPSRLVFGGAIAVAGTLWLLSNLGFLRFSAATTVPIFIIAWGVALLLRSIERQSMLADAPEAAAGDSMTNQFAVFAGSKHVSSSKEYLGGDAVAIFGGVELDLRAAVMKGDRAVFEANAIFGGVEIKVPQTWQVILQGAAVFGGWEDKSSHPSEANAPQLVVSGVAIFGGVSVMN